MDLILDELQRNNVDFDMKTLSHHINYLLEHHKSTFRLSRTVLANSLDLATIFYEIDVNNFGRAMSYLTLIYLLKDTNSEETTRGAIQLVAIALKTFDFREFKIEESFYSKMLSLAKRVISL